MSLPCDILIKPLQKFQSGEREGITKVWRKSGSHLSTFSEILSGKQKLIYYETQVKLHEAEPDLFPPPFVVETEEEPGPKFNPKAVRLYPSIQVFVDQANEAAENDFDEDTFLKMAMNLLKNEILKRKQSGKRSVKRTT